MEKRIQFHLNIRFYKIQFPQSVEQKGPKTTKRGWRPEKEAFLWKNPKSLKTLTMFNGNNNNVRTQKKCVKKQQKNRNDQEVIGKWADIGPYYKKHVSLQGRDTRWIF